MKKIDSGNFGAIFAQVLRGLLYANIVVGMYVNGTYAAPIAKSNSDKILEAKKFEQWEKVISYSKNIVVDTPSDVPILVAILESCVAIDCPINKIKPRGKLSGPQLSSFALAWFNLISGNPYSAKSVFESLARDQTLGWLGAYGLIEYAVLARNATLLGEAIKIAEKFKGEAKSLDQTLEYAAMIHSQFNGDYHRLGNLTKSLSSTFPDDLKFQTLLDYLIWQDRFIEAAKLIELQKNNHGLDHSLAIADFDFRFLRTSPKHAKQDWIKLLDSVNQTLKKYPNYWELRFFRISLLSLLGKLSKEELLNIKRHLPLRFIWVRLRLLNEELFNKTKTPTEVIGELSNWSESLKDFTDFHLLLYEAYMMERNVDNARSHLSTASLQSPKLPEILSAQGSFYLAINQLENAEKFFRERVKTYPNDASGKLVLAEILLSKRDIRNSKALLLELQSSKRYFDFAQYNRLQLDLRRQARELP